MVSEVLSLMKFEWMAAAILLLLLSLRIGTSIPAARMLLLIQVLLLVNLVAGFFLNAEGKLFGDMYQVNRLIIFEKNILNIGCFLISLLFADWFKKSENLPEFFILLLSALLGMHFMLSSGNLLLFYLALELATIPVAAMANFDLLRRVSSEAAMKMLLSSAFASGILLFGISLIYGVTGSIGFAEIGSSLTGTPLELMAFIFLFAALAFKLSVVPFHLWTADVYEGAPTAATAFLSVVSKAAVAFVLIIFLYHVFPALEHMVYLLLVIVSLASILVGNIFALRQEKLKRFLAFSSISQVGFILLGISSQANDGIAAVLYFVFIYSFSNLAAFAVIAMVAAHTGKETVAGLQGMYANNKFISWTLAISLFSLAGIPPTAGFFGKLFLLTAGATRGNYWFIAIAAVNMMVALYYYLRVVRAIFAPGATPSMPQLPIENSTKIGLVICIFAILGTGFFGGFYEWIKTII